MNQQTVLIVAVVVVAAAVLLGVWYWSQQRKRERLREHFGPEYDRVASEEAIRSARTASSASDKSA